MNPSRRLFLLGFLTLFLELVLIRYLAGNIWNLGYFPNLVLIAVFIGMGIGFTKHQSVNVKNSERLFYSAGLLLSLLLLIVYYFHPAVPGFNLKFGNISGDYYFTSSAKQGNNNYAIFAIWFLMVGSIFLLISQYTAKIFRTLSPLKAYTLDIGGSICGILTFMLLSALQRPAYEWFLILIPLFYFSGTMRISSRLAWILPILFCILISHVQDQRMLGSSTQSSATEVVWSPYQKIEYLRKDVVDDAIYVNGIAHQAMESIASIRQNFYSEIYQHRKQLELPKYRNVLVIGAGSGNDIVAALDNQVEHIDAVEIDPGIAKLGKSYHPEHPYQDSRVNLIIDDGRAFMTRTQKKYDLIIFALTDSLIKVSPMAQLRLENYLFTLESTKRAWQLLNDQGDLVFYNFYRQDWVLKKLGRMMEIATEHQPLVRWVMRDFYILKVGKSHPRIQPMNLASQQLDLPSDDWPFLYVFSRKMPPLYLAAILLVFLFVTLWLLHLEWGLIKNKKTFTHIELKLAFMLMGAAFLLLETKSIIQFSLLFGTTWLNSSLVFLAVLISVLLANFVAYYFPKLNLRIIIGLLIISCLLPLLFPLANLLYIESGLLRFIVASLMTFAPIFLANLIFSYSFREQKIAEHLFGWNLLGATLGGLSEYFSIVTGYGFLALIVVLLYALVSWLLYRCRLLV